MDIQKDKVVTDAMIWLARIERGLEAQEASQLRQWLLQPAHRDEIVNAAKLWHGPDIAAVLAELVPVGFGSRPPPMPRISRTFPILVGAINREKEVQFGKVIAPFLAREDTICVVSSDFCHW